MRTNYKGSNSVKANSQFNGRKILNKDFAEYCGVRSNTLDRLIKTGVIKRHYSEKNESELYIDEQDVIAFFKSEEFNNLKYDFENESRDQSFNRLKALIIEDEDEVTKSIKRVLIGKGFEIVSTDNGFYVPVMIRKEMPVLITVDLQMQHISGVEVIKMINNSKYRDQMIIVVISGEDEIKIEEAVASGADFYLKKPFSKLDLEKIVEKFYKGFLMGA
jgi:CheY-like chemotaxis protein